MLALTHVCGLLLVLVSVSVSCCCCCDFSRYLVTAIFIENVCKYRFCSWHLDTLWLNWHGRGARIEWQPNQHEHTHTLGWTKVRLSISFTRDSILDHVARGCSCHLGLGCCSRLYKGEYKRKLNCLFCPCLFTLDHSNLSAFSRGTRERERRVSLSWISVRMFQVPFQLVPWTKERAKRDRYWTRPQYKSDLDTHMWEMLSGSLGFVPSHKRGSGDTRGQNEKVQRL